MFNGIGLVAPASYLTSEYNFVRAQFDAYCAKHPIPATVIANFNQAWNGLGYRLLAAADSTAEYTASFSAHGSMPPSSQRYKQERALFNFFCEALSSLETLCGGIYCIGKLLIPAIFSSPRPPYSYQVRDAFLKAYPAELITTTLDAIEADPTLKEIRDTRNRLSHGGAPGRTAFVGSSNPTAWIDLTIDGNTTTTKFAWLLKSHAAIIKSAEQFAISFL